MAASTVVPGLVSPCESDERGIVEMAGTAHLSSAFSPPRLPGGKRSGEVAARRTSYDPWPVIRLDPRKRGGTRGGLIDRRKSCQPAPYSASIILLFEISRDFVPLNFTPCRKLNLRIFVSIDSILACNKFPKVFLKFRVTKIRLFVEKVSLIC